VLAHRFETGVPSIENIQDIVEHALAAGGHFDTARAYIVYRDRHARLRRIDGCFGTFVDHLKSRGLYDQSIVIFTADHGDSLGEQGRWGHAYTIYPEIMRIPLIMHVPAQFRELQYNRKAVSFSTDITPTLYYLTGHKPAMADENFGRSLFAERAEELAARRPEDYLVASSYAAVYGLLGGDGKRLSVADAVNYKDYAADTASYTAGTEPLNGGGRTAVEKRIKQRILDLSRFYRFTPRE
jgi:arylsulfatase A-like enzyme